MKTLNANTNYQRKHISFFIFMMLVILIIYGKASAQNLQVNLKNVKRTLTEVPSK